MVLTDDNTTLVYHVLHRTLGLSFTVSADTFVPQNVISRDQINEGKITFGDEFSVTVPNDGNPTLELSTPLGSPIYTASDLTAQKVASWVRLEADPSATAGATIYTMTLTSPSCAATH